MRSENDKRRKEPSGEKERMSTYEPKPGSRIVTSKKDAQIVGAQLEALEEKHGEVVPSVLLDAAKRKRHPLHRFFEWDDSVAAHEHRLHQARMLINSVNVVIEGGDKPPVHTQALVKIESAGGYRSVGKVLSDKDAREELIQQCWRALQSAKSRYSHLTEFDAVWNTVPVKKPRPKRRQRKSS